MKSEPSPTEDNGRDAKGRFGAGNRAGKGNPHNKRAQQIRAALFRVCKPADIETAARALLELAKGGDRFALAELLDRTIGRAVASDLLQRIEALEETLLENTGNEP
jgi:hypothetical protein